MEHIHPETLPGGYFLYQKQFRVVRVLGSGGYGVTYLAEDLKYQRQVAVKELFPVFAADRAADGVTVVAKQNMQGMFPHIKKRFCEEVQIMYGLRNMPEIVDVYFMFEENGTAYYVMEFLKGKDMRRHLIEHGTMRWEQLAGPADTVLRALHALHSRKLIHRDISPDNIFMLENGRVKLIDFGNVRSTLETNMTTVLKESFAPYEQYGDAKKQGPWTDIYSFCITMYFALSGIRLPSAEQRFAKWLNGKDPLRPIGELCPELPSHVAKAIQKGMAVDYPKRYQSVDELAKALFAGQAASDSKAAIPDSPSIRCVRGYLAGQVYRLEKGLTLTIGRQGCRVCYPPESKGISRQQCSLMPDNRGNIYVRDERSSFGTYLDGNRLEPRKWQLARSGSRLCFANEEYEIL